MNARHMAVGEEHAGVERDYGTLKSHLDQFAEDTRFLEAIRPELQNKFPDCWVAVYRKEVVGTGATLGNVMKQLAQKGVPASRAAIDFLRREPISLIL